jgi:hypothetical protein
MMLLLLHPGDLGIAEWITLLVVWVLIPLGLLTLFVWGLVKAIDRFKGDKQ